MIKNIVIAILLFNTALFAAGPAVVAKSDRSLWHTPLNSPADFDFASKMEMLVFIDDFNIISQYNEDELKIFLGLKSISTDSVNSYIKYTQNKLLSNFKAIKSTNANDFITDNISTWEGVTQMSRSLQNNLPDNLQPWYDNTHRFYKYYLYEQFRLAALFPKITSEILPLDKSEIQGMELDDKQFIMTFDDGPTAKNGSTDTLIKTLNQHNKRGIFFILGDSLTKRNDANVGALYINHITGMHGMTHQPHTKQTVWATLSDLHRIMSDNFAKSFTRCYFRPPYGQRNTEVIDFLKNNYNCKVMLWSIDSQDWSSKINEKEMLDRITSLTLLWRSGILLFHDTNSKSNSILPQYWERFDNSGVIFVIPQD